jgi:hypothetical protein
MAGIGQQALVRRTSGFDARGGAVEAGANGRDLVLPVFGHALVQGAGAKGLDTLFERFQPPCQPAHHRPGAAGHGQEQHHQQGRQAHAVGPAARRPARAGGIGRRWPSAPVEPPRSAGRHPQRAAVVKPDGLQRAR